MAERELQTVGLDQRGALGRIEGIFGQVEPGRRRKDHREVAGVVGCGQQQRRPRSPMQPFDLLPERELQPRAERDRVGHSRPSAQLSIGQASGKLDQRQRIARRVGEQPLAHPRRQRPISPIEQLNGGGRIEAGEGQFVEAGGVEATPVAVSRREQNCHPVGTESPCGEDERPRRGHIEPLRVVDEAENRPSLGRRREQRQHARRGEEAIRSAGRREAEGGRQRGPLGAGKAREQIDDRAHEAVQPRVVEVGFSFDAGDRQHEHLASAIGRVPHQRGLAHPGLGADHQRPALAERGTVEEPVDHRPLSLPTDEPRHPSVHLRTAHHRHTPTSAPGTKRNEQLAELTAYSSRLRRSYPYSRRPDWRARRCDRLTPVGMSPHAFTFTLSHRNGQGAPRRSPPRRRAVRAPFTRLAGAGPPAPSGPAPTPRTNAMSAKVPTHAVDRLIELYCEWRSVCWEVRSAYNQFTEAPAEDRALAYGAYLAALDREESAAGVYAEQMTWVATLADHAEKSRDLRRAERYGREGTHEALGEAQRS